MMKNWLKTKPGCTTADIYKKIYEALSAIDLIADAENLKKKRVFGEEMDEDNIQYDIYNDFLTFTTRTSC